VDTDGSFAWPADAPLIAATTYYVEVTDAAGNKSAIRTAVTKAS